LGESYIERMQRGQAAQRTADLALDSTATAANAIPVYGQLVSGALVGLKYLTHYINESGTSSSAGGGQVARDPGADYAAPGNVNDMPSNCPPDFRPNEALSALGPEDRAAAIAAGIPACYPSSTLSADRRTVTVAAPPPKMRVLRRGPGGQLRGQLGAAAPAAGNWMVPAGLALLGVGGVLGALQAYSWWKTRRPTPIRVAPRVAPATPAATAQPTTALRGPVRRKRKKRKASAGFS
jgi:hypothetical protein